MAKKLREFHLGHSRQIRESNALTIMMLILFAIIVITALIIIFMYEPSQKAVASAINLT